MDKQLIKTYVRGLYDLQKLRIAKGNRLVGNFKAKLGQAPGEKEASLEVEAKRLLNHLRVSYKRITAGVLALPKEKNFRGDEVISSYAEAVLVQSYLQLEAAEEEGFKHLQRLLRPFPVYTEFLEKTKGVGPAMAGVIISEIDISRARYPSSLWRYAGLDVGPDGRGRGKYQEHLVLWEYLDKKGNPQERRGITFNPFLKTKLLGVLASSFLRCGKENPYAREYYQNRLRLENHPEHQQKSAGHLHNKAQRYMIKRFLVDLHLAWRRLEGLPVSEEYSLGKLGMEHKN